MAASRGCITALTGHLETLSSLSCGNTRNHQCLFSSWICIPLRGWNRFCLPVLLCASLHLSDFSSIMRSRTVHQKGIRISFFFTGILPNSLSKWLCQIISTSHAGKWMHSQLLPTPKFNKLFISWQSVWNFSSLGNKCGWIYFPCSYEPDEFSTLDLYLWNSNWK